MGSYATTTSLPLLLPNYLNDNSTSFDSGGSDMFSKHIDRAESVVNSALSARYSLPFTTIPPIVRTLSEDIALYFLIRGSYVQDGNVKQEYVESYNWAIDELEKLRKGEIKLSLTDGTLVPVNSNFRFLSSSENYKPIINIDGAENWNPNQAQTDDVADSREL